MIDPGTLEALVDSLYERCGYHRDDFKRPSTLARLLYGQDCLHYARHMRSTGYCGTHRGRPLIAVHSGLSRARQEHGIAHEILHIELGVRHGECPELEWACDFGAAALQMPRRAYQRRINRVGADWTQLALDFGVTETSAALRSGEVEDRPIAVVAGVVRARGALQQRTESELRRFVKLPPPGIVSTKLHDERGRWVVEANWAEAG